MSGIIESSAYEYYNIVLCYLCDHHSIIEKIFYSLLGGFFFQLLGKERYLSVCIMCSYKV